MTFSDGKPLSVIRKKNGKSNKSGFSQRNVEDDRKIQSLNIIFMELRKKIQIVLIIKLPGRSSETSKNLNIQGQMSLFDEVEYERNTK